MSKVYHVKHILVAFQYEAEDVLRKLQDGSDFEALAQKFSKCPSASKGGDLGTLKFGSADEDFEEAVGSLKTGQVTAKPIRTKFGYHLIKKMS